MSQTTYNLRPAVARVGMRSDLEPAAIRAAIAEGELSYGLLAQVGTSDKQMQLVQELAAADVDAITATPLASAASEQVFVAADFDGEIGAGQIVPPRTLTLALNSHSDWLDSTGVLAYRDASGKTQLERITIPANGNVELKSAQAVRQLVSVTVPTQTGTNGTLTIGVDNTSVELDRSHFPGVVLYAPGADVFVEATLDVADEASADVIVNGTVWVVVEDAVVKGDLVYVRVVESGSDVRGQFTGTAGSEVALLVGASFLTSAAGDGLAVVSL